jgi:ketosteroid isomerase-like protein
VRPTKASISRENVEVIRRFQELGTAYESADAPPSDYSDILALLDPNIVVRVARSLPHGGEWVGQDGFVEMMNASIGARRLTDAPSITYIDGGGDYVICLISFHHEVHHSAAAEEIRMVEVFTVRDGKIASLDPYYEDTVPFAASSGTVGE